MQLKMMHSTIVSLLLIASICTLVLCRPQEQTTHSQDDTRIDASEYYGNLSEDTIRKIQKCDMDMDVMELCMRCAKVTKAEIVYPMCCGDDEQVRGWCHDYIYFGKNT